MGHSTCSIIPDHVVVSIFGAQINLPFLFLICASTKTNTSSEGRVSVIICGHNKKFSHRGIRMEMLVGTGWWDGIKVKSPMMYPKRRASETHLSRTTRRTRNARAAPKSSLFCHPPRLVADHLTFERGGGVILKKKNSASASRKKKIVCSTNGIRKILALL